MDRFLSIILYPIWPLGSYLLTLKRFDSHFGYVFFVLFGIFVNLNIILRSEDDIYRYLQGYSIIKSGLPYVEGFKYFYFIETTTLFVNLQIPCIFLYAFWSVVFYTGLYLCLRLLRAYIDNHILSIMLFVCAFFFINVIDFMSIRYFTGALYLIYFLYVIEIEKKGLKYTLLLFICPLMHFMHLPVIIAYYVYRFTRPKLKVLFVLFWVTLSLKFFDYRFLLSSLDLYSGSVYISDYRINSLAQDSSGLGIFLFLPLRLTLWGLIIIQYYKKNSLDELNDRLLKLAFFSMIFFNLISASPDFMDRFRKIMDWMMIIPIAYFWQQKHHKAYSFAVFALPVAFLLFNYNFFFFVGSKVFNISGFLTSNFFSAWSECQDAINRINLK